MNELINSLQPMLEKISEVFCVSIETVQQNGYEYLVKFGKYHLLDNCATIFAISFFIAFVLIAIAIFCYATYQDCNCEDIETKTIKKIIITGIALWLFVFACSQIIEAIKFYSCPEIYSINALMKLIK